MASEEGCVTLTWDIRNFSLFLKTQERQHLKSPGWEVEDTKGIVIESYLRVYHSDSLIIFYVIGFGAHRIEMFFMSSCGDVLLNANPSRTGFDLPKSALFDKNGESVLLNDTMTLCWRMRGKELKTSEYHIATVFHSLNHLWTIEELASSDSHEINFEQENAKFHVSLKHDGYEDYDWMVTVEGEPHAPRDLSIADCTLSMNDSCERVLSHQIYKSDIEKRIFSFDIDSNISSITLQLELIVALHGRHELPAFSPVASETQLKPNSPNNIFRHELSASSQVVRETQLKPNPPSNSAKHKNVSGALGDDFLLLYRDSTFSDATLNTEGKSFSAHRAVLSARSPVFRAMFEKDETSEGQSGVVDIDDVDSETVDRMLVYLYADSVGDLAWEEASALYYAADKYGILPLKEKFAEFLKDCLATDKACDVLVLADRHSDQELMTRVVDFILGHEEVVSSAKWEELEKGNPMLCAKIMRELFLKRGKK